MIIKKADQRLDKEMSLDKILKKLRTLEMLVDDISKDDPNFRDKARLHSSHILDIDTSEDDQRTSPEKVGDSQENSNSVAAKNP